MERYLEGFKGRLKTLYFKFDIDPHEKINYGDLNFMINASKVGTHEWVKTKLDVLKGIIDDVNDGVPESLDAAEKALRSWEEYNPKILKDLEVKVEGTSREGSEELDAERRRTRAEYQSVLANQGRAGEVPPATDDKLEKPEISGGDDDE